jgi:DNA-binding XRE family transcriptional regulator
MNKALLKSHMAKNGDTQAQLAKVLGLSLSRLNAKINETGGAEFKQTEIGFIKDRYCITPEEIVAIFFDQILS